MRVVLLLLWFCRACALFAGAFLLGTLDPAAAEPQRVLLLHSFGPHFAPWTVISARFREELVKQSSEPIDLYEASLDTARFREGDREDAFAGYLRALFSDRKLDLVVAMGAPAARFFQRHRAQLFPTPLLIVAEQRTIDVAGLTALDTVVATSVDVRHFIDNILQVLPETTTVAVAMGASPLEKFWVEELRKGVLPLTGRVKFEWLNELSFGDMLKRVAELPRHSAVFYGNVRVDAKGVPQDQGRGLAALRAVTSAPIFSTLDYYIGQGIVGGALQSTQQIGHLAAEVAVRILRGETPGDIRTPLQVLATPAYDWRELKHWNISEARLPAGSIMHFREPTAWQSYRWHLTGVFIALLVQAAMIAWLVVERHARRGAELEARGRLLELMHSNRTATTSALSASLSHELFQPLAAILSNAEAAELLLKTNPLDVNQLQEIVADIRRADLRATDIILHLRKLLKPKTELDRKEFDLNGTIAGTVQILSPEAMKRNISITTDGVLRPLFVLGDEVHLQQVLLNLASNGMDAMNETTPEARRMTINTALVGESEVRVSVSDGGNGIPEEKLKNVFDSFFTTKQHGMGLGLSIARTIIETYDGRIWAENRTGGGAVFHFTLPLVEARAA